MFDAPQTDTSETKCTPRDVAVIGSGYVGLTLAACLASIGHKVVCTDISIDRITLLCEGNVPIVELGLPELILEMLSSGRLSFSIDNARAAARSEFTFLCLPTPEGADGHADLSFVREVAAEIAPHLQSGAVLVNKSTVPVGTADIVRSIVGRDDVEVVSNPEFLAEGTALHDSLDPDRIVIGARDAVTARRVADLYGATEGQLILTDILSAELIKYASNAYLATRLTFVNSIAAVCDAVGADIRAVTAGMGADHRIGPHFLRPGPGWGGSCFPKDTQALVRTAERVGCDLSLVRIAIELNREHTKRVFDKIVARLGGTLEGRRIALWGLTFKAGTGDLRESPALTLATTLAAGGAIVRAYDPTVHKAPAGLDLAASLEEACESADLLLIATEWPQFATADLDAVGALMRHRTIVDARNHMDIDSAKRAGFDYTGVGLGHLEATVSADCVAA